MTKAERVDQLAGTLPLTKHQAETVVTRFFQCITEALQRGDTVALQEFGRFRFRHRHPRLARNPRTGAPVQIPAKIVPWFTVGKDLHARINQSPQVSHSHGVSRPFSPAAARATRGHTTRV